MEVKKDMRVGNVAMVEYMFEQTCARDEFTPARFLWCSYRMVMEYQSGLAS